MSSMLQTLLGWSFFHNVRNFDSVPNGGSEECFEAVSRGSDLHKMTSADLWDAVGRVGTTEYSDSVRALMGLLATD